MKRFLVRLRWPLLGLLMVAVVAVPTSARGENPQLTPQDKQKQIAELEQQLKDVQKKLDDLKKAPATAPVSVAVAGAIPDDYMKPFAWRPIGPANMGGRITALAVNEADPTTYYVATASGGLLKTTNNGTTFKHLFDKQTSVSIGDVALSESDPKIVWVGTGEANPRNSVSYGDGVYKSTDGGETFTNMGLKATFQIGKICIHPKNPDIVYVGALGRLYGSNPDRGVFKTEDGGKTWAKVLFVDDKTGVIDMRLDPQDPNTIIAALWERKRDEFDGFFGTAPVPDSYGPIVTHGPGGGLYKSSDAGKTWKKLTDEKLKNGLPTVKTGRMGLDYSRKTKGLIYAIIDTEKVGTGTISRVVMGINGPDDVTQPAKLTGVTEGGAAAKAGLKEGDLITAVDGVKVPSYEKFTDSFQGKNPNDKIKLTVTRDGKELTIEVTLAARPPETTGPGAGGGGGFGGGGARGGAGGGGRGAGAATTPVTGVQFGTGDKLVVDTVTDDGPAAKAGLKAGDVVTAIEGKKIATIVEYAAALADKKADDKVKITYTRGKEEKTVEVTLAANPRAGRPGGGAGGGAAGGGGGGGGFGGGQALPLPGFTPVIDLQATELKVGTVAAGGAAEKAGIKVGDLIVAVDGNEVSSFREFLTELRVGARAENPRKVGDKVKIKFKQGDKEKEVELALVEMQMQFGGGAGGPQRGASGNRPYGMGLGGQQANAQGRQGKDGYQTGGVFMSKDNGDTWTRVNSLNARPMYFSVIRVDPSDDKTLYVLCDTPTPIYRSTDGGANFTILQTARGVHADAHAYWINPKDGRHMIIGCDGGWYVTYDKGTTWEHLNHYALGQFYHVAVDNRKPYRVYGGLQDNGSWGGPSHTMRRYGPINEDWGYVSGGDGFVCRVDPTDPDLVYAESQGGAINRRNYRTGESASIRPRRDQNAEPLRFNWNTPFILSNHNPSIFYCGAQFVFRSVKKGDDLKQISPELTRGKKGSMTALAESPQSPDVLWAGTDDGFLWVSRDNGNKWDNVTANVEKAGLPGPWRCVATIEPSREKPGRCYVAFDGHRSDDDKPYLYVTEDFGATWKPIMANLPSFGSTRCLREDIVNTNVLYCGTELGAWVSVNAGGSWTKLGTGLPTVAVHEFAQPTVANEIVVATHGRSVWVLDINAIRQLKPEALKEKAVLFAPANATRWKTGAGAESPYRATDKKFVGTNPYRGASIDYLLTEKAEKVSLKVVDVSGRTIRNFQSPPTTAGLHRVTWDLSAPPPPRPAGAQGGGGGPGGGGGRFGGGGSQAAPGIYRVVLTVNDKEIGQSLTVELDPNAPRDLIAIDRDEQEEVEEVAKKRIDD